MTPILELAERTVEIPEGVKVEVSGRRVKVEGPRGSLTRDFSHMPVTINLEDGRLRVKTEWPRKREYAMVGTAASHIKNMIRGVTEGFRYKLKMVHAHFPITVKVKEKERILLIENFTGERSPRKVELLGDVSVKVSGEEITVEGINIEDVSQTAANIEAATKIKDKDQRVFLDGIYIFEKG
ncbi:MAG: 50S ribosomal protein L6 [Candidatus Bathyarchaeia archaeon]|nr:50S ribosomal protein L6 [Candidatus Bathyarchaeota archaeon]